MTESSVSSQAEEAAAEKGEPPALRVAPSPHIFRTALTTQRLMLDVLIGLVPVTVMAVVVFRWYAVVQVGLCILSCLAFEAIFTRLRGRRPQLGDLSAVITGAILGFSLPWNAPWYVAVIGSAVGIGVGKVVFGGLGYNIFNPAMVGRAFVMLSFAKAMGAAAYVASHSRLSVVTEATPLTAARKIAAEVAAGRLSAAQAHAQLESARHLWPLFIGNVNGSLGETSAIAVLIGGLYLCVRRTASWEIPAGTILAALVVATAADLLNLSPMPPGYHLLAGALLFGAFFIATDPVTSPLTPKAKFVFGLGVGTIVVLLRVFSGYPEGVMFAVLLMNAAVPLMNQLAIPRPLGGPARRAA